MITVGQKLPDFRLQAVKAGPVNDLGPDAFVEFDSEALKGKWSVLFWWPMDFTFVCPTEIAEFGRQTKEFEKRGAQVVGASTDTHFVHLAWRQADKTLNDLPIAMLADYQRTLSSELGILHPEAGVAMRATYIVDPEGVVRWVNVNDLNVGRNVDETLRVLDALQTGELTPCNWEPGEDVLKP